MFEAMRTAATKRVEEILENKHRRRYSHAAMLVACCRELSPVVGKRDSVATWIDAIRRGYSRFNAFQRELKIAFGSIAET